MAKKAYEKIFDIISHHEIRITKIKIVTIPNAREDVEKLDLSYIAGGKVTWYSHSGK